MKNITLSILFIFGLFASTTLYSQANNTFGSYWNGSEEIFTAVDMTNGTFTDIATLPGVQLLDVGESTFDPLRGYYINATNLGVTIISVQTGAIVNTFPNPNNIKNIEYNPISSKLYGSYWTGSEMIFTAMDLSSGVFTDIATLDGVVSLNVGESTSNLINDHYIIFTNLGVTLIDFQTGSIVNTFPSTNYVKGIQYDPATDKLYGSYWNGTEEIFTTMDISNGVFTDIGVLNGVAATAVGEGTFDTTTGHYISWTNLGETIINVQTAAIVNTFPNPNNVKGIKFVPYSEEYLGTNSNIITTDIATYPNPTNNLVNIISKNEAINKIKVFDFSGKLVYSEQVNTKAAVLDLSSYASGVYFAKISIEDKTITEKITKN